ICSALVYLLQQGAGGATGKAAPPARAPHPVKGPLRPSPAPVDPEPGETMEPEPAHARPQKKKYDRPARTGREPGMRPIFLNVGRKQLVTPADIVGKIAGVTRLPAAVVGAVDIHQRHSLVDVAEESVDLILKKLAG